MELIYACISETQFYNDPSAIHFQYENFDSESEFDKLMDPSYSSNNKKVVESEEESKDSDYSPSSSNDGRPSKSSSRTNFTNALLKYVFLVYFFVKSQGF